MKYVIALSIGTAKETRQVSTRIITQTYEKSVEKFIVSVYPLKKSLIQGCLLL